MTKVGCATTYRLALNYPSLRRNLIDFIKAPTFEDLLYFITMIINFWGVIRFSQRGSIRHRSTLSICVDDVGHDYRCTRMFPFSLRQGSCINKSPRLCAGELRTKQTKKKKIIIKKSGKESSENNTTKKQINELAHFLLSMRMRVAMISVFLVVHWITNTNIQLPFDH